MNVIENRIGFSKIAMKKAFKEVYSEGGSGTGLLIVKRFVERYGGEIELENKKLAMRFPKPRISSN